MKVFFVIALALAAAHAEPESDPELVYTDGTFHTNLRNIHKGVHNPYTYGKVGSVYNAVPTVGYYPSNVYSGIYNPYRLYKREAEAEPEADSQVFYNAYNTGLYGKTYAAYPSVYSGSYVRPYSSIYNPYRLYKREAEAEPEADSQVFYNAYNTGLYGRNYAAYPSVYSGSYVRPYSSIYNPYRLYKREAEAEPKADSQVFYNAYNTGLYGRTYAAYPSVYSGSYVRPYSSIYNPYRLYKREAEAEPEAEAQVFYNTGLYGRTAYSAYPSVYRTSAYTYPYSSVYRSGFYY